MSLLTTAKQIKKAQRKGTENFNERLELALAWARGDVDSVQAAGALKCTVSNVAQNLGQALRLGIYTGKLVEKNGN